MAIRDIAASVGSYGTGSPPSPVTSYPGLMPLDPRTPVLIGAGQFVHHAAGLDDALDATALIREAIRAAAADAGLAAVPNPDSIRVVGLLSWKYGDPAWVVANELGLTPRETAATTMGGTARRRW